MPRRQRWSMGHGCGTTLTTLTRAVVAVLVVGTLPATDQAHAGQSEADQIVQQLRELPPHLRASPPSDGSIDPVEQRRAALYHRLRRLGDEALPALARGLTDPDVKLRENAALALNALGGGWYDPSQPGMNLRPILTRMIAALADTDPTVRAWTAQAIGEVGPDAAEAVPALIALLSNDAEGSRNSACLALRGIGPAANGALPALRKALSDPAPAVARLAQLAIDAIQRDVK